MIHNGIEFEIVEWDWKDDVPLGSISEYHGRGFKFGKMAETDDGDTLAVVCTRTPIDLQHADSLYRHSFLDSNEEEQL